MTPYKNRSGHSGITAYETGPRYIKVQFNSGDTYLYDHRHPGAHHLAELKSLAKAGRGLATYISQHVRENYAKKL